MIRVNHFSFQYEDTQKKILDDIDLKINENDFIVITGKSGCGKTTLALAICGYLYQQSKGHITGSISINDKDIREMEFGAISKEIYLVQQNPENQFCTLTVQDEIAFGLENQGIDPEIISGRVDWALQSVDATEIKHRDLRTLSGGEQQKVAIASALALQPRIIILDEPTSFLDIRSTQQILDVLLDLRKKEIIALIIIEHKLSQLFHLHPRIINIKKGKLFPISIDQQENISNFDYDFCNQNLKKHPVPVIEIEDLSIKKGEKEILGIKYLNINSGDFISLLGDNGSGKTSLLYSILGINDIESGTRKVFGKTIRSFKSSNRDGKIGIVFQNPNHQFFTDSVYEEMMFPIQNFSKQNKINPKWIEGLIHKFKLSEYINLHPLKLSYGQKKKLSIASVLSFQPKLLLLDEVFIGQSNEEIIFVLQQLEIYINEFSATTILVNHQPDIVDKFSNRTIILDKGKISADYNTNRNRKKPCFRTKYQTPKEGFENVC
jgi:energy-coupling factor transport system ATP-binding protein